MALRNVITKGDPQLNRKSRPITEINDRMKELAQDLIETMIAHDGVGIAAPQVGVSRCMCVVSFLDGNPPKVMINPDIFEKHGSQIGEEGCLSVPGYLGHVERPQKIKVKYLDLAGNEHVEEHEDFNAVVICHEVDHLLGQLYDDKAIDLYTIEEAEERARAQAHGQFGDGEACQEALGEGQARGDSQTSGYGQTGHDSQANSDQAAKEKELKKQKAQSAKNAKAARKKKAKKSKKK